MTQSMVAQPPPPDTPTVPLPTGNGQGTPPPVVPVATAFSEEPQQPEGCPFLALIVPNDEGELQAQAMENWFQACATDEPFALEIVGTRREQGFVLRASSQEQCDLLCKQLEAQYPQCTIQRITPSADPLLLKSGERALIGEFALLQESWMPLKTFTGKALAEAGSDPLTGILAAMEMVGSGHRVVSQLALVRAKDTWLNADLRKSVEHALQHERDALALANKPGPLLRSDTEYGLRLIVIMALLFGGIFGYRWYQAHAWLPVGLLCGAALLGFLGVVWWKLSHNIHPLYDTKMVAEKMAKAGFYCQLRVMVISREPILPLGTSDQQREALLIHLEQQLTAARAQLVTWRTQLRATRRQQREHLSLPKQQHDARLLAACDQACSTLEQWIGEAEAEIARLNETIVEQRQRQHEQTRAREQQRERLLAEQQQHVNACLTSLEVAYRQFTQASANGLYLKRTKALEADDPQAKALTDVQMALPYASLLARILHKGASSPYVLNSLELAGMYHLPQESADLPLVRRVTGKQLLASPEIAHQIQHQPAPLAPALVGISTHRRHRIPVLLPFDALFSHKAAFGMSRSGKTVLMLLLTWAAMQRVRTIPQPGIFCIDPHRDFIADLLQLIAGHPELEHRLVLLDLTDTEYPVAINPLDATMGYTRDQAVSNLMSSFREIWRDFWGPRMSYFLNAVCLLLYTLNQQLVAQGKADQQYTLLDINPLLQRKDYALKLLAQLDKSETWHQELLSWWKYTYFTLPANSSFRQEIIMPILSKMGVFADNLQLRHIVGQPVTQAPVHLAVTEGKIVLCALSSKDMSEEAVNILGSTLVNLLHSAFSLQQPLPLLRRRKVFCALDEFHAFSGSQLDRMLSEDAKLGCSMLLATQNLRRLNKIKDGLMEMVFSNCQQLFAFRVSAADARVLEEELQGRVTQKHIISQPAMHCYVRLAMAGYPLQIVSTELARPTIWQDDARRAQAVEALLHIARQARLPVAVVEQRYNEHVQHFLKMDDYIKSVDRDVRGAEHNQQQLAQAQERAEALRADQDNSRSATKNEEQQDDGTPRGTLSSPDSIAGGGGGRSRNRRHHRSRRMGKQAPDQTPQQQEEAEEDADIAALKRFLFPGGKSSGKASTHERERQE